MTMPDGVRCTTSRRRFLQRTAALAAAAAYGTPAGAAEVTSGDGSADAAGAIPIIDTHQHLWDLAKFRVPWLEGGGPLARSFVPADYRKAVDGLNVVKAVYMEVDLDPAQQRQEAEYVIQLCRSGEHLTVAGVISGRPASAGFAEYISAYRGSPYIKGVRQVLHGSSTPPGFCLEEAFVRGIRLLGELGMCFDVCVRSAELPHAARLAELCPDTRLVLDHCGNADPQDFAPSADDANDRAQRREQWRRDIGQIARRPNVVCKISGIVARATPGSWTPDDLAPIVNHCLDQFGPDRVLFASDWPVCTRAATIAQWLAALKQIIANRDPQQQRKLLHDNARRFYGLS